MLCFFWMLYKNTNLKNELINHKYKRNLGGVWAPRDSQA